MTTTSKTTTYVVRLSNEQGDYVATVIESVCQPLLYA